MARTPLKPWKYVRDRGSSSYWILIIVPGQETSYTCRYLSIFLAWRYVVFSLKSPHWGDSYEYKHYTIFKINIEITLNYPKSADLRFVSKGLKNEFETAVVNKRGTVFDSLKFYCTLHSPYKRKKQCNYLWSFLAYRCFQSFVPFLPMVARATYGRLYSALAVLP